MANIEAHKTALDEQLAKHEAAQSSAAFDSEDPELNRHSVSAVVVRWRSTRSGLTAQYLLRAVLFHDGITVPGQHLYAYIRHEDGKWWKVQEHRATQVGPTGLGTDLVGGVLTCRWTLRRSLAIVLDCSWMVDRTCCALVMTMSPAL